MTCDRSEKISFNFCREMVSAHSYDIFLVAFRNLTDHVRHPKSPHPIKNGACSHHITTLLPSQTKAEQEELKIEDKEELRRFQRMMPDSSAEILRSVDPTIMKQDT